MLEEPPEPATTEVGLSPTLASPTEETLGLTPVISGMGPKGEAPPHLCGT